MATATHTEHERSGRTGRSVKRGGASLGKAVAGAITTDTILDIVDRLGLMDLVVGRVRSRLEEVDIDGVLDDIGDYLKRRPEVIVVGLGAVTLGAGVLVYLEKQKGNATRPSARSVHVHDDDDEEDDMTPRRAPQPRQSPSAAKRRQ